VLNNGASGLSLDIRGRGRQKNNKKSGGKMRTPWLCSTF
jgi:hypothetical protein